MEVKGVIIETMLKTEPSQTTAVRQSDGLVSVPVLFAPWDPFTVLGRIALFHVVSFKRKSWLICLSHIDHEVFKRFAPAITDCDAFSSVPRIAFVGWVMTSIYHRMIASVKRRSAHAVCGMSSCSAKCGWRSFAGGYLSKTSAIGRCVVSKVGPINPFGVSAYAGAKPVCAEASAILSWDRFVWSGYSPRIVRLVC